MPLLDTFLFGAVSFPILHMFLQYGFYTCVRTTWVRSSMGGPVSGFVARRAGAERIECPGLHSSLPACLYHDISKTPVKLKRRAGGGTLCTLIRCDTLLELPACPFSVQTQRVTNPQLKGTDFPV